MDWKPIDTAPKDGTEFQVWVVNRPGYGYWVPVAKYEKSTDRLPSAYYFESQSWEKITAKSGVATHWMPLPDKPEYGK